MRTICVGYLVILTGWTVTFDIQLIGYNIRNVVSTYSELSVVYLQLQNGNGFLCPLCQGKVMSDCITMILIP